MKKMKKIKKVWNEEFEKKVRSNCPNQTPKLAFPGPVTESF